jgi:hypothetical protein
MTTSDYGYGAGTERTGYVRAVSPQCQSHGCRFTKACQMENSAKETILKAQQLLDKARRESRTVASEWCERETDQSADGHPFNGRKGKVVITRTVFDGNGMEESHDNLTYCKQHAGEAGLLPGKDEGPDDIVAGELV